jgi:hypothetical protein
MADKYKLLVHNDGKEKYQSFEVWIEDLDVEKGYGETVSEAISEYKNNLKLASEKLLNILGSDISSIERVKVDWSGKPL